MGMPTSVMTWSHICILCCIFAGSNWALHKIILEMIKYFTLPRWYKTLIYYRLRTLGGNLLHKNLSPWLFAVSKGPLTTIPSNLTSLIPLLLMSNSKKERKSLKNQYNFGSTLSPMLTCGPAPLVHNTCVLVCSVCKGEGAYPCKSQKAQVLLQKNYLWSILEYSRRWFDMDWAPPDGSCIPMREKLIPWWGELSLWRRSLSHWWWTC